MARMTRSDRQRRAIAYHEAGHAVVGYFCPQMPKARRVTIVATDDWLGRVLLHSSRWLRRRLSAGDWSPRTEVRCYEQIMTSLAGPLAERRFTGRLNRRGAGYDGTSSVVRGSDYDTVSDLVLRLAGEDAQDQLALGRWLQRRTENMLSNYWKAVEAVAAALVERGTIKGQAALGTIIDGAYGLKPLALPRRSANRAAGS